MFTPAGDRDADNGDETSLVYKNASVRTGLDNGQD